MLKVLAVVFVIYALLMVAVYAFPAWREYRNRETGDLEQETQPSDEAAALGSDEERSEREREELRGRR